MIKFSFKFLFTSINRNKSLVNAVKTVLIAILFCCLGFSGYAQTWADVGTPGFSTGTAASTSIAIDGSGTPYVAYVDYASGQAATVMKYNGSSWVTVGSAGFSAGIVVQPRIAIDGSGTPYVVYEDVANGTKATVMKFNGTSWVAVGSVGFSAGEAQTTSIAIDGSGNPYVAFTDGSVGNGATVMKYNGTSWVIVGSAGFSAGGTETTAIKIDGSGTPYVVYEDFANGQAATVMKYNGTSWVTAGSAGFSAGEVINTTIAIDGSGTPYVTYSDAANGTKATVMKYNGSSWVTVGIAGFSTGFANNTTIAIDGSGTPYVVYQDEGGGPVTVKKYNGTSWVNAGNPDFSAGIGGFAYMAINGSGVPYVVYEDVPNGNKATVMRLAPGSLPAITGASTVCVNDSITLSDATTGGIWTIGSTGVATVNSTSGIVTGVTSGTAIITYIVTGDTATDVITVNPAPNLYNVIGGGSFCAGSGTVETITLSNSDIGVNYQLVLVGTGVVGSVEAGTGSALGFGTVSTGGTYDVIATNLCTDTMFGSAVVTVNPVPLVYSITGGGNYCSGMPCPVVGLTGSDIGVTYQLYCGGTAVPPSVSGTGSAITFGPECASCTYVAVATYTATGCSSAMTGSVTVTSIGSITPISGSPIVCIGLTTPLTDGTTGGTWSSSTTSVATVGSATGIVDGVSAGTATITYTVGACTATIVITVPTGGGEAITGLYDLCQETTELIHDVDTGGYWSSTLVTVTNLGSGSARVSAYASGEASVTYTLPSGCTIIDTLYVDPLPVISTRDETVCEESSISYSALPDGGTWASSNTGVALVGSSGGIIYGVSGGTSIITYTLPTGCTDTTLITVNPLPAVITGTMGVCVGQTTVLSDATGGGEWTSGNTSVATVTLGGGTVSGNSIGTAAITYMLPTGCFVTTTVSVNAVPVDILGSGSVCVGFTDTLSDATAGGIWASSNTAVASVSSTSGVVTGVSFGTAIITYLSGAGCYSTFPIIVDSLPSPITGVDSVCVELSTLLTSSPLGGVWSSSNGSIAATSSSGLVTGVSGGYAVITYMLATGCYATDSVKVNPAAAPITGVTTFCVGSTTTLSDASGGGSWYTNNLAADSVDTVSGLVTGISVGSSLISYVLPTGCLATVSVDVTPVPGPILGTTPLCAGSSETFTDDVTGGKWRVSDTSLATIDSTTGFLTAKYDATPDSVTVTYSLGSCAVTFSLSISPILPITGPDSVCEGSDIYLVDSSGVYGGTWSVSGPEVDLVVSTTGDTAITQGINVGTGIITFTTTDGCIATHTVVVDSTPVLSFSATLCVGDSMVVSSATPLGTWSSSGGILVDSLLPFGADSAEIYGEGPGISFISYTLSTGCGAGFTLTVNPLPGLIGGNVSLCQGSSTYYGDGGTGTWSVSPPTVAIIGSATGYLTGLSGGSAVITFTLGTGCYAVDTITVDSIGPVMGLLNVCIGNTAAYTDYPVGGSWSSSNTATGTIDPVAGVFASLDTGTTNITYTTDSGCNALVTVTVDPLPDPITGRDSVCVNSVIRLRDADTGGIWGSSDSLIAKAYTTNGNVQGMSQGTATITYTLPTGCFTDTVVVVDPLPLPITGTMGICLTHLDSTQLHDATAGGVWSSGDPAVGSIAPGGLVYAAGVGTLMITYTLPSTGCYVTAVVTVYPPPVVTVSAHNEICIGGSDVLTLTGGVSYAWTPAYGLSSTEGSPVTASPTVTTTYTVTVTTAHTCYSDTEVTVTVDALLRFLKVVGRDSICIGSCDTLMASGRDSTYFSWKPATALSCTICDTVVACPDATQTYTATAVDAYGCRDSVEFTVTVMPLPSLSVFENPAIVCRGTPKQLLAYGAWSYVWTPPYFLSCDTCSNPVATDTSNFIYELYGATEFGCRDSISVRVSVLDTNYNRAGDDTVICLGGSAQLDAYSHSVTGNLDVPSYMWYDNTAGVLSPATALNNAGIPDPVATPDTTTLYSVVIDENACFSDTIPVLVTVDSLPVISITANPPQNLVVAGTAVQLTTTVTADTAATYLWTPAISLSCDNCPNPIATPSVNTLYTVVVTSNHGCVSSDTVTIDIICSNTEVFIPNTFTPNGDGVNDIFYVSAKGISIITRMSVYNRWGQTVFQANNIPADMPGYGWDGTYKGLVVEPDVFDYVIDVTCELGQTYEYTGTISIVR